MSQQYVTFEKTGTNLRITLTDAGREKLADDNADAEPNGSDAYFVDFIEHYWCNGWEMIQPWEVGALTNALLIADSSDCERDSKGQLTRCDRLYSNIDYYQVEGDIARLLRLGELVWRGSVATEKKEN